MDTRATLLQIKADLRAAMNGVASAYMRQHGSSTYKVNFGVEMPRLQTIAADLPHTHELAQALWKEDIRECKLLALMLHPTDSFSADLADVWMEQMPGPEMVTWGAHLLFARLPYAPTLAFNWMAHQDERYQQAGFLIMARLLGEGAELNARSQAEFLDQAQAALGSSPAIRQAATAALQRYANSSSEAEAQVEQLLNASD